MLKMQSTVRASARIVFPQYLIVSRTALDGREVDGAKIVVEKSRGPRPKLNFRGRRTDHRVTVEDLPMDCSWQDLKVNDPSRLITIN
jgi:hypothetical protein